MAYVYRKLKLADDYPISSKVKSDLSLDSEIVVPVSIIMLHLLQQDFHLSFMHIFAKLINQPIYQSLI